MISDTLLILDNQCENKVVIDYFIANKQISSLNHSTSTTSTSGTGLDKLRKLCFNIIDNKIVIDYKYFKCIASYIDANLIIHFIVDVVKAVLTKYTLCCFHINMQGLTLSDIDKHYSFIRTFSVVMKNTFPDKLDKCYIYNTPFIFSKLFNLISQFIDKGTQKKIILVSEKV